MERRSFNFDFASLMKDKQLLTKLAIGFGTLHIISYSFISYRSWLELGPGGVPYNFLGWMINASLHLVARNDTRIPAPYKPAKLAAVYGPAGSASFLGDERLPPRSGARATIPSYVVPQRQTTQHTTPEMLKNMRAFISEFADLNLEILQRKNSGLEGPTEYALFLAEGLPLPGYLKGAKGEFAHPHRDGSSHVTLSLADSAKVIELGWAERHKLSGVVLPWGYVIVYAPRNEEELGVWKNIVVASAKFVTADGAIGSGVRVP